MLNLKEWHKIHRRYIKTKQWLELRTKCYDRDDHKCQVCGSEDDLSCHHRSYEHFMEGGESELDDCITLCKQCHIAIHRSGKTMKRFMAQQEEWLANHQEIPYPKEKEQRIRSEKELAYIRYWYWKKNH